MKRKSFLLAGLLIASPVFAQGSRLPDGPAKHTVETACSACHALSKVTGAGHGRAEWDAVVHKMINAGAQIPAGQIPVVVDYLAENFPPKTLPSAVNIGDGASASGR